ncbi:hypothetical protein KIW84_052539 [Lathyrus oleraceus]|uniref:MULE transposase domain-containing protein n=1 Tax=Pisum sativum TaxID=3888 RepID=A0A9D4WQ82_PEA|nr:hypothetical protein KIW84_052539 [Pisum sativum]
MQCNNVVQIIYKNPVWFAENRVKFYQKKIRDDDDVQHMFVSHGQSGYNDIKLYILPHQQQVSQFIDQSQVFCETDDEQAEVNVPDDKEEVEIMVDSMVNADEEEEPIPASHVYFPPQHMARLNLGPDEPSADVWYNPYVQMQGSLKQGDTFRTKEECVKAIKKFHMQLSTDSRVDRTDTSRAEYEYTPSYRKAWIARTKVVEKVFGNWEESYKQLPKYLLALKQYAPGTIVKLETLPAYTSDGTCAVGNRIFHRLFWTYQPCVICFSFYKPIIQIDGTWLYGKYKGTLLMVVAQDGNNNIFSIAFALVEGETAEGWGFFLRNL